MREGSIGIYNSESRQRRAAVDRHPGRCPFTAKLPHGLRGSSSARTVAVPESKPIIYEL